MFPDATGRDGIEELKERRQHSADRTASPKVQFMPLGMQLIHIRCSPNSDSQPVFGTAYKH